jgi:hypothetical protein
MPVPKNVKCVKIRLGTSEQKVAELWLPLRIETDDFAIEHTPTPLQVASKHLAQAGKALEDVSVAGDQPYPVPIRVQQCTKAVPFDLKNPIWMGKRLRQPTERHWLKLRQRHWIQYSQVSCPEREA